MHPPELQDYLRERIPLSRALGVEVRSATPEGVQIYAPFGPNINHRDTVFGGSACAVAILAAWSALLLRLQADGLDGRIVIHRNTMIYERPITGDFTARAAPPDAAAWTKFRAAHARRRMVRLHMLAHLECGGEDVGTLDGEFVVLPLGPSG